MVLGNIFSRTVVLRWFDFDCRHFFKICNWRSNLRESSTLLNWDQIIPQREPQRSRCVVYIVPLRKSKAEIYSSSLFSVPAQYSTATRKIVCGSTNRIPYSHRIASHHTRRMHSLLLWLTALNNLTRNCHGISSIYTRVTQMLYKGSE